jgi:UDP-N-acetylglucosamine acyltransferase
MAIHSTAIVDPKADLGADVHIGPYSIIGPQVKIGRETVVESHVTISGDTIIGERNHIHSHAAVGVPHQSLRPPQGEPKLRIGSGNSIREFATVSTGWGDDWECTTIVGDNNLFMAYTHVAHDCKVGNNVVMANCAQLGGHVQVDDLAIIGGLAGIHQFCRVGTLSFVGGMSKVPKDVPPYCRVDGNPARCQGLNSIGLERNGVPESSRLGLKRAYRILFRSGLNTAQAIERINEEVAQGDETQHLISFIEGAKRGVTK